MCLLGQTYGTVYFANYTSNIGINSESSKLVLKQADKIYGWGELSVHKQFGPTDATTWAESYQDDSMIGVGASQDVASNLILSNSNALTYIEENYTPSRADILYGENNIRSLRSGLFTDAEKQKLAASVCTKSDMFKRAVKIYDTHKVYTDNMTEEKSVYFKDGFTVHAGKTLALRTPLFATGHIDLSNTGVLNVYNDMHVGSGACLDSGGVINGNGNTLVFSENITIPESKILRITGDTIIDGRGMSITLEACAQITVDSNVTLTIKNARIVNTQNSRNNPMITISGSSGRLALQNVELVLADDYYFDTGQLFVHDNLMVSSAFSEIVSFVYASPCVSYITERALFGFDEHTRFYYNPSIHDNTLVRMHDKTSCLYLNGATLEAGAMGIKLSTGILCLDKDVLLKCPESTQIIFDGNLDVHVLAEARLKVIGNVVNESV